jgi:hypothetical protein
MRVRRGLIVGFVLGAILAVPLDASADGGAFIDFQGGSGSGRWGSHFLPGDSATGGAFVSVPKNAQDLLDRGPFYGYLVGGKGWIQPGRPLPEGTLRLGTVDIRHDSGTVFELTLPFTVPDVTGDYYNVQICNDPCTVAGFRETLSGQISIVQTEREAELLNSEAKLWGQTYSLRRQVKKAGKELEALQNVSDLRRDSVLELSAEVSRLERELEAARAASQPAAVPAVDSDRPLVEAWALVAFGLAVLVAFTAIGLALVFSRRGQTAIVVPDTIAELDEDQASLERV